MEAVHHDAQHLRESYGLDAEQWSYSRKWVMAG